MRVFISSTVYNLIDVRAELAEQLRTLGITPVLSDDKLSDFRVQHDVNSIETCLINVDSCDEVILILDRRYGATLEEYGYGEISATHLEYQRAIEKKIPIRVYVRDRLEADFSIWKRNKQNDLKLSWIDKKDVGLFNLLNEHTPLETEATTSNWYDTFTSSIDLKAAITKHFEKRMLPERLTQAIQSNNFPLIDMKVDVLCRDITSPKKVVLKVILSNVGNTSAFHFCCYDEGMKSDNRCCVIFSPNQSVTLNLPWESEMTEKFLIVEYKSPIGISVYERFKVTAQIGNETILTGGELIERKFKRTNVENLVSIEDD